MYLLSAKKIKALQDRRLYIRFALLGLISNVNHRMRFIYNNDNNNDYY